MAGMKAPQADSWAHPVGGGKACHVHVLEPRVIQVILPDGKRISVLDSQKHVTRIHCLDEHGESYASAFRFAHQVNITGDMGLLLSDGALALSAIDAYGTAE